MELQHIIGPDTTLILNETAINPNIATYSINNDSQQLTSLMLEIITYQMQERALFTDFENFTTSLN